MTVSSPAPTPVRMPSFAAVLDAARAGGEWAFETLFRDYQPALLRYLRGQADDLADDIAGDTWLDVARGLRTFAGDADDFRAWLFTIARHRLIDERRRTKRRPSTEMLTETEIIEVVGPETIVMAGVAGDLAAQRIAALLPPDQADVILLRVVADLSVEQVAAIVGKKPGAVRVLQSRGLARLRERLSEKGVTQ